MTVTAADATKPEPDSFAEDVEELVELTTKAQGVPFYVEDPAILRRVA